MSAPTLHLRARWRPPRATNAARRAARLARPSPWPVYLVRPSCSSFPRTGPRVAGLLDRLLDLVALALEGGPVDLHHGLAEGSIDAVAVGESGALVDGPDDGRGLGDGPASILPRIAWFGAVAEVLEELRLAWLFVCSSEGCRSTGRPVALTPIGRVVPRSQCRSRRRRPGRPSPGGAIPMPRQTTIPAGASPRRSKEGRPRSSGPSRA